MTNFTIGQRIASRRKLLNLSQEALSERLNVSRQAVSKWESDTAIPEIDKLIALAKIFDVSVGWLLGVEAQPQPGSDTLTEPQLKMVEELVKRYHTPRRKHALRKMLLPVLCLAAVIGMLFFHSRQQNRLLAAENAAIRNQIEALSDSNTDIRAQISQIDALLSAQIETSKLLRSYVALGYLNNDLATVDLNFYFFPKVYHENVTAYLSILNPASGVSQMLECRWVQDRYLVHASLPLADNYQYSFLLVSDSGYQEEILSGDTYYSDLLAHSCFYIDEADPKYARMMTGESVPISPEEALYCFDSPLHIPCIIEKTGQLPFQNVTIVLTHNGESIWQQDYTEQFREVYDGFNITSQLNPDISVELPELSDGDRLILELTATTFTERTMVTVLDDLIVTAS